MARNCASEGAGMPTHDDLIEEIRRDFADTASWTGRPAPSPRLMSALATVDRAEFVPASEAECAYLNTPLPIGRGQTISQPYIVAIMTDLLDLAPEDRVLEIGTGSAYQAAVLATLARHVYTVEVIPELATGAAETLRR